MNTLASVAGYQVLASYGSGSMAELFEVQSATGERCLLKRPKLSFGSHPACYAGFEVEQMIYAHIDGSHVPCCHAQGEDDTGPYLIIEHVPGSSLAQIAEAAPLPYGEVTRLGILLADALHALHRQNVVHHDLTPSHVLLSPTGRVVLIDFGLACHGALPDLVAAESSGPLGTPAIIAPEQILGVRGDPRSDIYAAGAILYRLATGRYPFGSADGLWGMHQRRWLDPVLPCALRPDIPASLQEIILRCLAVRPERRYASAAQLAHDLSHPEKVSIGQRGRHGFFGKIQLGLKRWWAERTLQVVHHNQPISQLDRAPHIMVAIDTDHQDEALAEKMRLAVRRLIAHDPHWRVTCVSVLEPSIITEQDEAGEIERSFHTAKLAALHHWAHPLDMRQEQIRFHVLTGNDAATSLIDYARSSHVDHLVMGARGSSSLRRLLGSVSSRVAAEAPCSVTVVRI